MYLFVSEEVSIGGTLGVRYLQKSLLKQFLVALLSNEDHPVQRRWVCSLDLSVCLDTVCWSRLNGGEAEMELVDTQAMSLKKFLCAVRAEKGFGGEKDGQEDQDHQIYDCSHRKIMMMIFLKDYVRGFKNTGNW